MRRRLFAVAVAVLVVGCGPKKQPVPADKLWTEGNSAFNEEAWDIAADRYKRLLDQHPFDPNAEEAELRIAQTYYLAKRYPEAIAHFSDFERMHPTSAQLPFVEYHLGMSHLAQATTSDRDQQSATNALTYFRNVVDRFPKSEWAAKGQLRMKECRETLAHHEYVITIYYLHHRNLKAAESRLRGMLTEYPDTDATAQALHEFAQEYTRRDESEGATLALATIAVHHPQGPLANDARTRLGVDNPALKGDDPLPQLVAKIDQMSDTADRRKLPTTVSAYPNQPPSGSSSSY